MTGNGAAEVVGAAIGSRRDEVVLAADLAWLDGLLARLADPDFAWGPAPEPSERYLAQRQAARL